MRVEKHNYQKLILNASDKMALDKVMEMLADFSGDTEDDAILESQLTGECIRLNELKRVRGVLGFFLEPNQLYEIKHF